MTRFIEDHDTVSVKDTQTGKRAPFIFHASVDEAALLLNSGLFDPDLFEWEDEWEGRYFPDLDLSLARDLTTGEVSNFEDSADLLKAVEALNEGTAVRDGFVWASAG